jgi:transketolase
VPVRLLAHHAGISFGFYGTSHHATEDIAIARSIEKLVVVSPCDAVATRAVLRETVDYPGPVYVRLGRGREIQVYEEAPHLEYGRFVQVRSGKDATIIATGITVAFALAAAEILSAEDVDVQVLDAVFLKPIDEEGILLAAAATGCVLTVEEHGKFGGLGGAVAEVLAESGVSVKFHRQSLPDEYALIAPPTALWKHYGLSGVGIAENVRKLLVRKA